MCVFAVSAIALVDGHVVVRFDTGSGPATLRTPESVVLDVPQTIHVSINRDMIELQLGEGTTMTGTAPGPTVSFAPADETYLGSIPDTFAMPGSAPTLLGTCHLLYLH